MENPEKEVSSYRKIKAEMQKRWKEQDDNLKKYELELEKKYEQKREAEKRKKEIADLKEKEKREHQAERTKKLRFEMQCKMKRVMFELEISKIYRDVCKRKP